MRALTALSNEDARSIAMRLLKQHFEMMKRDATMGKIPMEKINHLCYAGVNRKVQFC